MKRLVEFPSESGEPIMVEVEEAEDHGYLAERKLKARRAVEDIGRVHREISATHGLHLE